VFYGTFSTNRLYHAIEVGDVSHRAGGENKYHAIKQLKNAVNEHNRKLSSAWALYIETIPSPRLGFFRQVFLANHLASNDNLTRTTKRQNTYQLKLTIHKRGPNKQQLKHAKI